MLERKEQIKLKELELDFGMEISVEYVGKVACICSTEEYCEVCKTKREIGEAEMH